MFAAPYSSSRCKAAMSRNVYVASLPRAFGQRDLEELFTRYGPIESATLAMEPSRVGGVRCKGYGFVMFKHAQSAESAIAALDMTVIGGRVVQVRMSDSRPPPKKGHAAARPEYVSSVADAQAELVDVTAEPMQDYGTMVKAYRFNPYSTVHAKEEYFIPWEWVKPLDTSSFSPRSGYSSEVESEHQL